MPRSIACRTFSILIVLIAALLLPTLAVAQTPTIRRITNTPPEGINLNPTISGDGRRIAFESTEDITNSGGENYFRAIRADVTTSIPTFVQLAISRSPAPAISQDGTKIAFASKDNPLGSNPDGNSEIFYYDGQALQQVTNTSPDDATRRTTQGNFTPSLSDDGTLIAFISNMNLDGRNADRDLDIFIYNTSTRASEIVSTDGRVVQQTLAINNAFLPKISGDGRRIAFIAELGLSTAPQPAVLLYERATNELRFIANAFSTDGFTLGRAISDDGTRIVYVGRATPDTGPQIFFYDDRVRQTTQITTLASLSLSGRADIPLRPSISGDGRIVTYATRRQATDANSDRSVEVYIYDSATRRTTRITNAPASTSQTDETALEIITSLNDVGTLLAFNFPRILTDTVANPFFAANSEIYLATFVRQDSTSDLRIVNGASFGLEPAPTKAVAPDSIAVGTSATALLSRTTQRSERLADGAYPRNVGGTTVTVNNRPAQIIYVSPDRVDFIVPAETETGTAQVTVRNSDGFETSGTVQALRAAPGVFTETADGRGEAVAVDAATSRRSPFDPVDEQGNARTIIISTTGVRNAATVTVTINNQAQQVVRIERARDTQGREIPGLDLIYVTLSSSLRGAGQVPVVVRADNRDSNQTTLTFTGTREAASVELTPTSATTNIGGTVQFRATVRDSTLR